MAKKQYFLTIDTETTINNKVVDMACVISDRGGNIINQMAVIIAGIYKVDELFFISGELPDSYWSKHYLPKKYNMYDKMLDNGQRMLANVNSINRWLERANKQYNPVLTAYNLPFDIDKMRNTGIDCDMFEKKFCLWKSAQHHIASKKAYKKFIIENHYFTNRTKLGNMTIKTNAEVMTHFLTGNDELEPHTSLEDVIDYELPILNHLLSKMSSKKMMDYQGLSWQNLQVKDHFTCK